MFAVTLMYWFHYKRALVPYLREAPPRPTRPGADPCAKDPLGAIKNSYLQISRYALLYFTLRAFSFYALLTLQLATARRPPQKIEVSSSIISTTTTPKSKRPALARPPLPASLKEHQIEESDNNKRKKTSTMPQHEHMERHRKLHGRRFDAEERERKREARLSHKRSEFAQKVHGLRAKLYNQKRFKEKATMRKTIAMHNERSNKHANDEAVADGAVPAYLLDREGVSRAKVLSNTVKQKRKEKAGKWEVPIPKVKPVADDEMFKVMRTGMKKNKAWKRVVTKCTFVGDNFTRKAPKYERFIRPTGLRMKRANVTHPELKTSFQLDILGVKKNPSSTLYTNLGVLTKGTIIEVNVSDLGLVTTSGKVAWGKMAQVTNNPELDGCVNAVLLV